MKSNVKGPHDMFSTSNGEGTSYKQSNMDGTSDKEVRAQIVHAFSTLCYLEDIPRSALRLDSFKKMVESIANYGPGFEFPSYEDLAGLLLENEVDRVNKWIDGHKEEWPKYGCSIMLDSWTDREQRTVINVLVNSFKGTVFLKAVDASSFMESETEMYTLLNDLVERVGEANVVQVITDNRSKSLLAGKFLMMNRGNLFLTHCVAHSIDLILEDIGNIAKVKTTIKRAIFLIGYIYNDYDVLNMMKEFTNKKDLPRTGITRLTTTYLTLQSLHKHKACLKSMFTCEKWRESVWAKEAKGKAVSKVHAFVLE
ncbi:uncharacterized protein LOC143538710 isoform X1 [Bidens hawaiensis]|uniref:uncharacterized protein LOC143538710 isoform X1 n=1 Tax=Bidens hawaiensis TaxID=980011 RepID=UPI0040499233